MAKSKSTSKNTGRRKTAASRTTAPANGNGAAASPRLNVQKTYKLYIGGAFPRTESGRFYSLTSASGELSANICRGSRKDFRNAVVAARKAFGGWAGRSHFNRSQIIYRIAEMLEGRKAQFVEELMQLGASQSEASDEVFAAIDRLIYYAGWADKYQQIFSSVNPVASSHFNFSVLEPTGVVAVFAPEDTGLLGLVSTIVPAIVGGNSVVVLASESKPTCSISFAEVLNSSDVPGGVVNILTGHRSELVSYFSSHMDVNAFIYTGSADKMLADAKVEASHNVKRVIHWKEEDWYAENAQSPYKILDLQETKTTWHPIGI